MIRPIFEEQKFDRINFTETEFPSGDYENCIFVDCVFSNTDLSGQNFTDCTFIRCNFSLARTVKTALRNIRFKECKLLGLHFETCSTFLFSSDFEDCLLNLSSFYQMHIKKTRFKNCSLQEVDFTETDLTGSLFEACDLTGAMFEHTLLEKVDFRTSHNFIIDPEVNRIKKAMFSMTGLPGLLNKYHIEIE